MSYNGRRLARLRSYVLVLTVVIVFAAIATPIAVVTTLARQAAATQLSVTCEILEASIRELQALEGVRRELGLPRAIEIPALPPQCEEAG